MNKIHLMIAGLSISSLSAFGQNEMDALNLSQTQSHSTALSLGMGGVGGSMGGDFSGLSINPAGIGVYRAGELTITPGLRFNTANGTMDGNTTQQGSSKLSLDNLGFVLHNQPSRSNWKSVSIGFGMNTIQNFNLKERSVGTNYQSSISDMMSASALTNGVDQNIVPPYGFLGYQGYLLDNDYDPIVPLDQGLIQDKLQKISGSVKEYNLTIGGNYAEKFHIGVGLGLNTYSYNSSNNFLETDATNNKNNYFEYADLTEDVSTTGFGINAKLGIIYNIASNVRIGASVHTPTYITLTDINDYYLKTNTESFKNDAGFTDINPVSEAMPDLPYQYDYSLKTPWKVVLSGTLLGSRGMISADYEMNDFSSMQYIMDNDKSYEDYINKQIENTYQMAHTLRIGGELVFDNLFLRAGGAYHTSPYQNSAIMAGERMDLSIGAGLRWQNFFIDLGYMNRQSNYSKSLYSVHADGVYNPLIGFKNNNNYIALTMGFKMRG